jgi:LPS sulfotransferase NodH
MTGFNAPNYERLDTDISGRGVNLFVVIGAQRTGTNILREILNTNEQIAMLGEVLTPSPAPAHWENFCRTQPLRIIHPESASEAEALLDRYFEFVQYRIRHHWEGNRKSRSHAFGVDIKYNQLRHIAPANWSPSSPAFILGYLRSREATLVHTTRNVVHCAISTMIASRRNLWHNYEGAVIDCGYHLDIQECLEYARTILKHREAFMEASAGCKVVNCSYENLTEDIARAGTQQEIPDVPGPLQDIAQALESSFTFRYDRRLQKAINIPYSKLISNYDLLIRQLKDSEFSTMASTLE